MQPVSYSNLLMLVVNTACENTMGATVSVTPEEIMYDNYTLVCQKALSSLKRKRPQSCIRWHERESKIKDQCGLATSVESSLHLLVTLLLACALAGRNVLFLS